MDIAEFEKEIVDVVKVNTNLVTKCREGNYNTKAEDFLFCLSQSELQLFGTDVQQINSNYGILVEGTDQKNITWCYKKPLLTSSAYKLSRLATDEPIKGVIHYQVYDRIPDMFCYIKVLHNPLKPEEMTKCLHDFVASIIKIVQELNEKYYLHKDVRVPNVCFNEKFEPILIDLDLAKYSKSSDTKELFAKDMKVFVDDLLVHCGQVASFDCKKMKNDEFIQQLRLGNCSEELLQKSILTSCKEKIITVIRQRS